MDTIGGYHSSRAQFLGFPSLQLSRKKARQVFPFGLKHDYNSVILRISFWFILDGNLQFSQMYIERPAHVWDYNSTCSLNKQTAKNMVVIHQIPEKAWKMNVTIKLLIYVFGAGWVWFLLLRPVIFFMILQALRQFRIRRETSYLLFLYHPRHIKMMITKQLAVYTNMTSW